MDSQSTRITRSPPWRGTYPRPGPHPGSGACSGGTSGSAGNSDGLKWSTFRPGSTTSAEWVDLPTWLLVLASAPESAARTTRPSFCATTWVLPSSPTKTTPSRDFLTRFFLLQNNSPFSVPGGWNRVADSAQAVLNYCDYVIDNNDNHWTSGQNFERENWNTLLKRDIC